MVQFYFDGYEGLLLLLLFYAASSLVGLGAFQGGDEGVRERRLGVEERARRRREAVEGDVEAELECAALERVGGLVGLRFETGAAEDAGAGAQQGGGDMERSDLSVAAPPCEGEGVLQHGGGLRGEGLLRCTGSCTHNLANTHPLHPPLEIKL